MVYETVEQPRRAFLVSLVSIEESHSKNNPVDEEETVSLTHELASLSRTLGLEIAGEENVRTRGKSAQFGMGSGKAAELAEKAKALEADCLIFDDLLSPSKQRNWEKLTGISVLDRQELIIQIFAARAQTREAELQVDLARLQYSLPRLQHKYLDLSRQRGGRYGTKGSGETKLETDRRLVEQRIQKLKQDLALIRKERELRRKRREQQETPVCSLVGYTNAGKSSLLNALTGADVFVEDKLFATLDATTRQLDLGGGRTVLLTDTVGFIRRLPHTLVDAFRSTLEEAALADILIHVLDASDPAIDHYFETTLSVLRELGADKAPVITVLNKADRLAAGSADDLQRRYADGVFVSAKTGQGLAELRAGIEKSLGGERLCFSFPPDRGDLSALLHREGKVITETYGEDAVLVEAQVEKRTADLLKAYIQKK
jgi:GTP-binding protein HflX